MADREALRRRELAVAALGLTVVLMCLVVGVDATRHHAGTAIEAVVEWQVGMLDPAGLIVVIVALADAVVFALAARSILREVLRQRSFLRRLPVTEVRLLHGVAVRVIPDSKAHAFCIGLLAPHVFVSTGALERLRPRELHAVVAHAAEHAARRDSLRLLLARAVSDTFPFLPCLRRLATQQAELAELAADAAAVRAIGSRQPLASALLAFGSAGSPGDIAPERVDQLVGRSPARAVSRSLLAAVGGALAGLVVLTLCTLLLPDHFEPYALSSFAPLCSLAMVLPCAWPAVLACRRA